MAFLMNDASHAGMSGGSCFNDAVIKMASFLFYYVTLLCRLLTVIVYFLFQYKKL